MLLAELLSGLVALSLALLVIYLAVQIFCAARGPEISDESENVNTPRFSVVVPAHNEEEMLGATLDSIMAQVSSKDSVLVVADNCDDRTAEIARQRGALVVERDDDENRGKGYALEHGLTYLRKKQKEKDIVAFIDADCRLEPGCLQALVRKCDRVKRPVQALYLMKNRGHSSPIRKIAELAWIVKNRVRPLGLLHLGLPCQLMGTGMAFPVEILQKVTLGSANIVEDMQLGLDCAAAGFPPVFCPGAAITSDFPSDEGGLKDQRIRWEHGHVGTIFSSAFYMLGKSLTARDRSGIAMAVDLIIPPLALFVLILVVALGCSLISVLVFGVGYTALVLLTASLCLLCVSILTAWFRFGRKTISLAELIWVPGYVLLKLPIYVGFWIRRQTRWIRASRD